MSYRTATRCARALCASLSAICASNVFAQANSESLEEIVVTAQKREESLQKVPISITVLSGAALDQQALGGTLEALAKVPGVSQNANDLGSLMSPSIRGVAANASLTLGGPVVGYYVDNVPFGTVRSAYVPNTNDFDMARIEVLRGPQGTLFGASALNGVIHIVTNDADPTHFELKARAGLSSTQDAGAANYRGDVAVNIPIIQDRLAVRIAGSYESLDGWIDQPVRRVRDANTTLNKSLRLKVNARPTDNLTIDLLSWVSRQRDGAAPYADDNGNQATPLAQPFTNDFEAYNARISFDQSLMTISSSTSYMDMRLNPYTDFSYFTSPALPTTPSIERFQLNSHFPARVFSEELLINSRGDGPWRWSAGAFYRTIDAASFQLLPALLPGTYDYKDTSESTAQFFQVTRALADDHFEISAGLRNFDDEVRTRTIISSTSFLPAIDNSYKFHAVTPRVVATWLPDPHLTFYASYSQGFRSGFGQFPLTLATVPDIPPNRPDKLHNYELGSKGNLFGGLLDYDVSVYYMNWEDVQIAKSYPYLDSSGTILYVAAELNGPSASGLGTDITLTLHPLPGLQIGGTLSYNDLTLDGDITQADATGALRVLYPKGDRLQSSVRDTESLFLNYSFDIGPEYSGRFNISANFRSELSVTLLGNIPGAPQISPEGNSVWASDSPRFVDASVDLMSRNHQTVTLYGQNLGNWDGLLVPQYNNNPTTPFRPRPRTIGIQYSATF